MLDFHELVLMDDLESIGNLYTTFCLGAGVRVVQNLTLVSFEDEALKETFFTDISFVEVRACGCNCFSPKEIMESLDAESIVRAAPQHRCGSVFRHAVSVSALFEEWMSVVQCLLLEISHVVSCSRTQCPLSVRTVIYLSLKIG
ncbi:hypothetical protein Tco_1440208 [Tanacetum coccineum]